MKLVEIRAENGHRLACVMERDDGGRRTVMATVSDSFVECESALFPHDDPISVPQMQAVYRAIVAFDDALRSLEAGPSVT